MSYVYPCVTVSWALLNHIVEIVASMIFTIAHANVHKGFCGRER